MTVTRYVSVKQGYVDKQLENGESNFKEMDFFHSESLFFQNGSITFWQLSIVPFLSNDVEEYILKLWISGY